MSKDKKKPTQEIDYQKVRTQDLGMNYLKSLDEGPKYNVEVDPTGFYGMSDEHKRFIKLYIEYRNLGIISELMDLEPMLIKDYFTRYSTQQEIRRINAALYHRQVATNIISFEDLGSYLSSWLIGSDITESDRLKKGEKLQVVRLLMDWHKSMKEFRTTPALITTEEIEAEIKTLSVANIKQLLATKSLLNTNLKQEAKQSKQDASNLNKNDIITQLNSDNLFTEEELAYLDSLSVKELLSLLKDEGDSK